MDILLVRLIFVLLVTTSCYVLRPFGLPAVPAAGVGIAFGVAVVYFEMRLHQVSLKRLIGAVIGSIFGILGAYLVSLVIHNSVPQAASQEFLQLFVMLVMAYVGLIVGANKGDLLNLSALGGIF